MSFLSLLLIFTGFIIGLGAVTVIDLHGFLGRTSAYWTEATTRTHKVTKPLIWIGMMLLIVGSALWYRAINPGSVFGYYHAILFCILVLNGYFLSFRVSPFLLAREKLGKQRELLPVVWQRKITVSFLVSFVCWWGSFFLFILQIIQ